MSKETILSLEQIGKSFRQGTEILHILNEASLTIGRGEMVALVGPSGSGKSTLLQIAGLLDNADSGSLSIAGIACSKASDSQRTTIRRQQIGFVYQFHHLLPDFSAQENVAFPLMIQGSTKVQAFSEAAKLLDSLGLGPRLKHRPAELSGGEQQRVAIARAIISNPSLLLADEPTGNLDPITADSVLNHMIKTIHERRLAALIVTHNLQLAEKMDRRITIQNGSITELP